MHGPLLRLLLLLLLGVGVVLLRLSSRKGLLPPDRALQLQGLS